jgi:predicted alpha/beta-hydrolase family hydrolase
VASSVRIKEIETPVGVARAHVSDGALKTALGLAVLGHGAGGGVEAPDLLEAARTFHDLGYSVACVEQPYRVAGRRAPDAAPKLDAAWIAVVAALRGRRRYPVIVGGRSSGARVACRTAAAVGAEAVLALAFPLHPPGKPEKSRIEELAEVTVPVLVIQGDRDPFGDADAIVSATDPHHAGQRRIVGVPGDHSLRRAKDQIGDLIADWLESGIWR